MTPYISKTIDFWTKIYYIRSLYLGLRDLSFQKHPIYDFINGKFQLKFEEDLQITQMFSAEEECVTLNPPLYPKGNVENWLLVVEDSMRNTGDFTNIFLHNNHVFF